ncbi:MAG: T9SS type A sorting domain-containing protein [Bacteroidota bacterium]|nr:T9SS type A sorting domain-containing protein [Bacteroidota bacterium]
MKRSILVFVIMCFIGASFPLSAQVDTVDVTFQVNMRVKILEGYFNTTTEVVRAVGEIQDPQWSPATAPDMVDPNNDSIYTVTYRIPANASYQYKYNIGTSWAGKDELGGKPNRSLVLGSTNTTLAPVYFDNDSVVTLMGDGNIMFKVDMTVMAEIGIYQPDVDKLQVRGSFNGWSGDDTAKSHMNQDIVDPNLWFINVPFVNAGIGEIQYYKYYVNLDTPGIWLDAWERPCSRGGGNREATFLAQPNQVVPTAYYDDIHPDWVIVTGNQLQAKFRVNMKPAMDPIQTAVPFVPGQDTLFWICEQPSFVRTQGWTDSDTMKVLILTDPDNDSIYTGTLSIGAPSFNSFVYRYAYKSGADGGWQHEPAGFGAFAYRVRFIGQDVARSFPINPWTMPVDTWTNDQVKTDQETDPYTSLLLVREAKGVLPTSYQLHQNYPNPFNPNTSIRFEIMNRAFVSLKVFNVLGQEVATLVNEELTPGTYRFNFDASGLASGLYFYKITAGEYVATKKMLFVK